MRFNATKLARGRLMGASVIAGSSMAAAIVMPQAAFAQDAPSAVPDTAAEAPDANQPAADPPAEGNGEIVVTGYRAALESAINTKRRSNNIVDAIKADDMASFPDANLAESIQRIPGVSITRDAGEGRSVTVRGLGGEFVRTTLNGIEAFSATTGSTLGVLIGINRSRGFDFSTFASELFNAVTVSKSQSAEMDEGSLSATIDLQTGKPFDKPGFRAAASMQGAYYDINKSVSPRVSGLISTTSGNWGVLLSGAFSKRRATEDGYSDTSQSDYSDTNNGFCGTAVDIPSQPGSQVINTAIPYVNALSGSLTGPGRPANQCFSGRPSDPTAYAAINQPNIFLPRNPGLGRFELDQTRIGLAGAVQWRPSDATRVTFDAVYSRFNQNRRDFALSNASNNRNVNGASTAFPLFAGRVDTQIMDVNVDENGQVDYMRLNNVDIKHIQEISKTTTDTHQLGLVWEQKLTDRLGFIGRVAQSGSNFKQPWDVFVSYDAFNRDNYIWDSRDDVRRPFISYGYDVTDPSQVTFTNAGTGLTPDIRLVNATVKNTLKTAAADFKYDLNDNITFKVGGMVKRFEFVTTQEQRMFGNNGPPCTVSASSTAALAGSTITNCAGYRPFNFALFAQNFPNLGALSETTSFGSSLGLPEGSVDQFVVPNVQAFIDNLGLLCNCANQYGDFRTTFASALGSNRTVKEKDLALYAQTNFNFDIGGRGLRGNFGVRRVNTKVEPSGYLTATTILTAKNSYRDWLPSANLAFDITPDLILRAAAAKVMARPGFTALTPGGSVNTTFGAQSATIGNPFLNPYRAKNYDLSLEYYPQKGAFYGVALFYKDVGTMIQNLFSLEPYGDTGLPLSLLPAGQDATTPYNVTRTRNTSGGYIKGLELNMQQPFTFLPGALQNFGIAANYTFVKSSVLYYLNAARPLETVKDDFPNVSPHAVNLTFFYEDQRFSGRVSGAYRSAYLVTLPFKASLPDGFYSYATLNVDASASYKINRNLKITADALNLTNQAADQYSGKIRKSQRVYSRTGRQFFLGVAYNF